MFGKKMTMAMAMVLGMMVITPNVDAAVRPTNIRYGEGQTVQVQEPVLTQTAKVEVNLQPQIEVKPLPQTPILSKMEQPGIQNKPAPIQTELNTAAQKQQEEVQQDLELQVESALVVGLGKSNPVYDVSDGHFVDFLAKDAVHKNKYALVCNANNLQEFELCKAQLERLGIEYEPVDKAGVIPEEIEKRVASYLGTDNVIAITFKHRDEEEAKRLKEKDSGIVKGILGMIPGGSILGGLF